MNAVAARRRARAKRVKAASGLPVDLLMTILGPWFKDAFLRRVVEEHPEYLAYMGVGFQRRFLAAQDLGAVTGGRRHMPVVYFARVGRYVKIGTTRNLRRRMAGFYLGLEDVLAVVPGGQELESAYHARFRRSRHDGDGRAELFFLDRDVRFFLWRLRAPSLVRHPLADQRRAS